MRTITNWDYIPAGDVKEGDILDTSNYWAKDKQWPSLVWVDSITHTSDVYGVGSVTFNDSVTFGRKRHVYVLKSVER